MILESLRCPDCGRKMDMEETKRANPRSTRGISRLVLVFTCERCYERPEVEE
jgi:hypothetical protein